MSEKGSFIVLEGIDGSGKSTQIDYLVPRLTFLRRSVVKTREPYDEPENEVGFRIRQILLGEEENPGYSELQQMFVAARKWHLENIVIPAVNGGKLVLCDRYTASTYAYHRSKGGHFDDVWAWHCECNYPADVTVLVRVSAEEAARRMVLAERKEELFDKKESLIAIHGAYEELLKTGDEYVPDFRFADGEQNPEKVSEDIMKILREYIPDLW